MGCDKDSERGCVRANTILKVRLKRPIYLRLCPKPRFGGNSQKRAPLSRAGHSGGNPRYPATKDLTLSTLERPAPVFALGYLKPVGRLGALVPLEAMRILHHALSDLTCRIGGCLVPLEQTDN